MKMRAKKYKTGQAKIGLSIDPKVADRVYAAAKGTSRTLSGFFEYAVKKEVEIYEHEQSLKKETQ